MNLAIASSMSNRSEAKLMTVRQPRYSKEEFAQHGDERSKVTTQGLGLGDRNAKTPGYFVGLSSVKVLQVF
jgi:hypothetical protein